MKGGDPDGIDTETQVFQCEGGLGDCVHDVTLYILRYVLVILGYFFFGSVANMHWGPFSKGI